MKKQAHPYMPNSAPGVREEMLATVGARDIEEILEYIPEDLRYRGRFDMPEPLLSEAELNRHMRALLAKNISTAQYPSFLGGGCYRHYVPAVCDEINGRSEFLTAYCGEPYTDHGKCQAIFEFTSLVSELVDMDVVGLATYDGGQALSTALAMACRVTEKRKVLVPQTMNPELLHHFKNFADWATVGEIAADPTTGMMDLDDLRENLDADTAAVLVENPSYLGFIEANGEAIGKMAHDEGALFVVAVDPLSLGVMEAPANYGADITCGDLQACGVHMLYGSGQIGFIAAHDRPEFIMNFPNHFYSLYENEKGEFSFARSLNSRTSYGSREKAVEYLGTNTGLWAITVAVYLSLMGPAGMREIGAHLLEKVQYLQQGLASLPGVELRYPKGIHFKEVAASFSKSGMGVNAIQQRLLQRGIFGGIDVSRGLPVLGESALFCVTELTTKADIDALIAALAEIIREG